MERPVVLGRTVDDQTRCAHYSGPTDVIAIKFKCCGSYYPCFECHRECAGHPARQWPADEWAERAILCGVCRTEHPIRTYLNVLSCPACHADFNERCRLHRHLYFAVTPVAGP
ncbi:MAG TPA: CHY zinc finger protein [Nakamurella sp.]